MRTCQRDQDQENCLTLATTFNPNTPNIFPVIKKGLQMLMSSSRMKSVLSTIKIIYSRKQPPNLKQLLVKSKFKDKTEGIVSNYGGNKCYTCKQLKMGNSFYFKSHDLPFKVKQNMDCNSKFVTYVLTCAGCGENYIGETKTRLRERMTVHWQHIRDTKYTISPVSEHIARWAVDKEIKFTVFPFPKMNVDDNGARWTKGSYFIQKFKPLLNSN